MKKDTQNSQAKCQTGISLILNGLLFPVCLLTFQKRKIYFQKRNLYSFTVDFGMWKSKKVKPNSFSAVFSFQ